MAKRVPQFWLIKSEPNDYSIDDLARDGREPWDGVRNYSARNLMRDKMAVGDLVLFYHSSTKPVGVVGIARVASEAYADPTQFDTRSKYFDPKSTADKPRWQLVDMEFVEKLPRMVELDEIKADPAFDGMVLVTRGRLSVQPVERSHFAQILRLGGSKTKVRAR